MILYFSGTGNSRYAAKLLAMTLEDSAASINELLKSGNSPAFDSDKPFVFVCPTYAWRIPRAVDAFIRKTSFEGSRSAYFVLTCGDSVGNAGRYARKTCEAAGLVFMGLSEVLMPENYVALFRIPSRSEIDIIMRRAISRLLEISKKIGNEQSLTPPEKIGREAGAVSVAERLMSGPVNAAFYRFVISAKGFHVTEGCTGCGRCVTLCPLNNVTLRDGKPRWGSNCTHCMACICGCPSRAVEYKNKTQGKPRYFNTEEPV